jgi:hypothetical protein
MNLDDIYDGKLDDTVEAYSNFVYERPPREGEINGYCVGDRIGVVDGKNKGLNGHIVHLSSGCQSWCRTSCNLVYVLHGDPEMEEHGSWWPMPVFTFNEIYKFPEIAHVD